jgi:hypothetical protein
MARMSGAMGAALVLLAMASSAQAHFTQSLFSYSDCDGGPTDPLNVAFFGRAIAPSLAAARVERRLGWPDESGSTQYFKSHGGCIVMSGQRSLGFQDKHHLRFFFMPGTDRKGRRWIFSDAHRERKKFCGFENPISDAVYPEINGVSGFDQGAREVYAGFSDRYRGYLLGPNRRTFKQCTGELVGWNGVVYLFHLRS